MTTALHDACRIIAAFVLVLVATVSAAAQSPEQLAADAKRVIEALALRPAVWLRRSARGMAS